MKRNIKFKAKKLNSCEWVEGDLVHIGNRVCIGGDHLKDGITDVDPSTVCMFTGLRDRDGKEIWEGDIVRDNYDLLCIDNLYEVVYIEEEGTFAFKSLDKVDNYEPFVNLFKVYVVGNKFDKE
jgi:uncharacterized phage protein (TIGR01671 family)